MKLILFILSSIVVFSSGLCRADGNEASLPKEMKYFPEERKYTFNDSALAYLEIIAARRNLQLYKNPNGLLVDAFMTDSSFEKSILISVNRRANPEYTNKLFKLSSGILVQAKIHNQQIALFFLNFPKQEVQETFESIRRDVQASNHFSLFINNAEAGSNNEAMPANTGLPTPTPSPRGSSNARTPENNYLLSNEFLGCGKGIVKGLNDIARYPWDAAVEAGKGAYDLFNDPSGFWQRSVDQFKSLANVATNFRQYVVESLSTSWDAFQAKSNEEKSEMWCNYLGTPGLLGAAGKVAKGAGALSKTAGTQNRIGAEAKLASTATTEAKVSPSVSAVKAPAASPVPTRASTELAKIDANISSDFFSVPRGTPSEALAENQKVLNALRDADIPNQNPKRLSALNKNQMNELFHKVNENPVADLCNYSKYDPKNVGIGFCFGRAAAAHIEALNSGLEKDKIRKIWAVGSLKNGETKWGFHVATIVKGPDSKWWAIDPIMLRPIPVDQWYAAMKTKDAGGDMRIFTSEAKRFGPSSPAKYSPHDFDNEFYNGYFEDLMGHFKQESREVMKQNQRLAPKK